MSHQRIIPLAEVAKHRGKNANWFVIHDSVYDVTEFMAEHPGGEEVMLEQGGGDATEAFEDAGHSGDVRKMMDQYKIGVLPDEECQEKEIREKQHQDEERAHQELLAKQEAAKEAEARCKCLSSLPTWLLVLIVAIIPVVLLKVLGYVNWFDLLDM